MKTKNYLDLNLENIKMMAKIIKTKTHIKIPKQICG